jgi:hypothetical protein
LAGPPCRLPPTDGVSPAAISSRLCELAPAGSRLCAENRELRVLAASDSSPTSIQGLRAGVPYRGLPVALLPVSKAKARALTHASPNALASLWSLLGLRPERATRRSSGDPSPGALAPRKLCLAAVEGDVGLARVRRAPGELLPGSGPGAAKMGARDCQGQPKQTLLGTGCINSPLTCEGVPPPAVKTCGQEGSEPERWAPLGPRTLSLKGWKRIVPRL